MGCFRIVTADDFNQITQPRKRLLVDKELQRQAGMDNVRVDILERRFDSMSTKDAHAMAELLADPRMRDQKAQIALAKGLSNPFLDEKMATAIPAALAEILRVHPETAGLFTALPARGPGARPWIENLDNPDPDSTAGTAYEVLATKKLMRQAAGDLRVYRVDKIAFGPKLQARYEPSDLKTRELLGALVQTAAQRWESLQSNPRALARRTVESDLHIGRPSSVLGPLGPSREIFVDFKHSRPGTRQRHLETAELLGVAVALAAGEIHEAHFVCNVAVSKASLQRINDINEVLGPWGCGTIRAHQHYRW